MHSLTCLPQPHARFNVDNNGTPRGAALNMYKDFEGPTDQDPPYTRTIPTGHHGPVRTILPFRKELAPAGRCDGPPDTGLGVFRGQTQVE